jgi:hypothetical protein
MHSRHFSAHFAMILSSLCFSQFAAQASQATAQAAAMAAAAGPLRAEILKHVAQISAQSMHVCKQSLSPLPAASKSMQ